jgi:hypothetical protein
MRAQTILFLLVDRVRGKLDCRPYRSGGEGNPKRLVEAASLAFPTRSIFLTIRVERVFGSEIDYAQLVNCDKTYEKCQKGAVRRHGGRGARHRF